jgi:hypothetical protein
LSNIDALVLPKKLFGAHAQPVRTSLTTAVLIVDRNEIDAVVRYDD